MTGRTAMPSVKFCLSLDHCLGGKSSSSSLVIDTLLELHRLYENISGPVDLISGIVQ